ncbi:hypothetical protein [Candidatus Regiella insecticola]|uniref:Uncharacterized protein n=1 Tax=Candidatus Regiella insecticola TaxID=138073 RepID=A0A6L2ZP77_9ENTR|nr:hypothetical protein [Candidatus Regiella insecticola]GFN46593.1 hypothetical protein RINTU1_22830 [Candidatus Regiella insecticola]
MSIIIHVSYNAAKWAIKSYIPFASKAAALLAVGGARIMSIPFVFEAAVLLAAITHFSHVPIRLIAALP